MFLCVAFPLLIFLPIVLSTISTTTEKVTPCWPEETQKCHYRQEQYQNTTRDHHNSKLKPSQPIFPPIQIINYKRASAQNVVGSNLTNVSLGVS